MFNPTLVTHLIALLCTGLSAVDARTIAGRVPNTNDAIKRSILVQREAVSPPITYPTTGTVWTIGSHHNVTWDTSVLPSGFKSNGMIVLGFLDEADGANEHLDLDNPLAENFPITNGRTEITVPSVTTRDSYILVLFGDSGNASGKFTIKNISIGSPPSPSGPTTGGGAPGPSSSAGGTSHGSSADNTKPSPTASPDGPSTGTEKDAVPTNTAPALQPPATGSLTPQGPTAAEPASTPAASTPSNAAYRSAAFGGSATWMSVACALGVVIGFAL